jgi:hypothetical protein
MVVGTDRRGSTEEIGQYLSGVAPLSPSIRRATPEVSQGDTLEDIGGIARIGLNGRWVAHVDRRRTTGVNVANAVARLDVPLASATPTTRLRCSR